MVDYAYLIHTEIGNKMIAAKVNYEEKKWKYIVMINSISVFICSFAGEWQSGFTNPCTCKC